MSFSHLITFGWSNGGTPITKTITKTSGAEMNLEEVIAQNQTDALVACTLDVSQIQSIVIVADTAMTIETNSGSAADDTIVLVADQPLVYVKSLYTLDGSANENPFDVDVTALYVTTGAIGSAGGTLKIRCLYDPTV